MNCPRCGFEQADGPECARCGVVFAKLRTPAAPPSAPLPALPSPLPAPPAAVGGWGASGYGIAAAHGGVPGDPPPASGHVYGDPPPPPPAERPGSSVGHVYGDPPPAGAPPFTPAVPGVPTFSTVAGVPTFSTVAGVPTFKTTLVHGIAAGDIINETFSIYFANFFAFLAISVLAHLPALLLLGMRQPRSNQLAETGLYSLLSLLLSLLARGLTSAGVTFGVLQRLRNRTITAGECLERGFAVIVPVVAVALLQALLYFVSLALCIVPFFFVWPILAVAVPAAVEERPGPVKALNRSAFLTDGYRGTVFAAFLVLGVLTFIAASTLTFVVVRGLGGGRTASALVSVAVQSVADGVEATLAAVLYYRLRSVKEAIDVNEIASVFD